MDEGQLLREPGVLLRAQGGIAIADEGLCILQDLPDPLHHPRQERQVPLFIGDGELPVPLVDVHAVVVVEEVVLADRPHVRAQAFAGAHSELPEGHPLPLGRGLDHLGLEGVPVAVVRDVELDGGARAVAVEVVVNPAFHVDDEGHRNHGQAELAAEVLLDVALDREDRVLGLPGIEKRAIVRWQDLHQLVVVADARSREIRPFVQHRSSHGLFSLSARVAPCPRADPLPRVGDETARLHDGRPRRGERHHREAPPARPVRHLVRSDLQLVSFRGLDAGGDDDPQPRLIAFCRKMRAKPRATITSSCPFRQEAACSREEPQPKLRPATTTLPRGPPSPSAVR